MYLVLKFLHPRAARVDLRYINRDAEVRVCLRVSRSALDDLAGHHPQRHRRALGQVVAGEERGADQDVDDVVLCHCALDVVELLSQLLGLVDVHHLAEPARAVLHMVGPPHRGCVQLFDKDVAAIAYNMSGTGLALQRRSSHLLSDIVPEVMQTSSTIPRMSSRSSSRSFD